MALSQCSALHRSAHAGIAKCLQALPQHPGGFGCELYPQSRRSSGYLGPNGSGKSTTVKIVIGLIEATSGQVVFDGRNIWDDLQSYRAQLGYVPEEAHV